MIHKARPLYHQVLVILGATTATGRMVLRQAAERGARVFMIGTDEDELQVIQDELRVQGHHSAYAVANLGEVDQIQFAADQCLATFGTIDSWINLPRSVDRADHGTVEESFWSAVNGSNVAVPLLAKDGGVLINVGTAVGKQEEGPVQSYTDGLRKELHEKKVPVTVSFIATGSEKEIAEAILKCAEAPKKEILPGMSLKEKILTKKKKFSEKNLIASGLGGIAVLGGMTFFLMRKLRII